MNTRQRTIRSLFGLAVTVFALFLSACTTTPAPTALPVTPTPAHAFTQPADVDVYITQGKEVQDVFSFTSITATQFAFYGYPTSYGPGINWVTADGGISLGKTVHVRMEAINTVPIGTYTGTGILQDQNGARQTFKVTVHVTSNPCGLSTVQCPGEAPVIVNDHGSSSCQWTEHEVLPGNQFAANENVVVNVTNLTTGVTTATGVNQDHEVYINGIAGYTVTVHTPDTCDLNDVLAFTNQWTIMPIDDLHATGILGGDIQTSP